MKKFSLVAPFVILIILSSGCSSLDIGSLLSQLGKDVNASGSIPFTDITHDPDKIICGSWNIQDYGPTKASKPVVVNTIASTISGFSLIAVQEISNAECSDGVCDQFTELLAKLPSNYTYRLSSRVGRSSQKEQYAVIYDKSLFTLLNYETFEDTYDIFEREPGIYEFRYKDKFGFVLIVCHVRPDSAPQEISALETVVKFVSTKYSEPNIIVLGDLNSACSYFSGEILPSMVSLIPDYADTTVGTTNCAYDRIFVSPGMSLHVEGANVGYVLRSTSITKEVSDHYPVYFYMEKEV